MKCCSIPCCEGKFYASGWCHKHWLRNWRGKEVIDFRDSVLIKNEQNGTNFIPLTKGAVAIVDKKDYDHLSQFKCESVVGQCI